jgi:hypothetical protein
VAAGIQKGNFEMNYFSVLCPDREFYLSITHTKNDIICEFLSSFEGLSPSIGLKKLWNGYKKKGYKVCEVKLAILK